MTTQQLRQLISVSIYINYSDGGTIKYYIKKGQNTLHKTLHLGPETLYAELLTIGSVDNREEFEDYQMSQWDAINIAIRHEYALSLEKESEMINLNNALKNLKS